MYEIFISIHAPTRGATPPCITLWWNIHDFNPRSHEGSDYTRLEYHHFTVISIHAPTRGATRSLAELTVEQYISIHAPTRGAT